MSDMIKHLKDIEDLYAQAQSRIDFLFRNIGDRKIKAKIATLKNANEIIKLNTKMLIACNDDQP